MNNYSWVHTLPQLTRTALAMLLCVAFPLQAQQAEAHARQTGDDAELQTKVADLDESLRATREELAQSRAEIRQLRVLLEKVEQQLTSANQTSSATHQNAEAPEQIADRVGAVEEQQAVLQSQIEQEDQKKVESASKYPVRLTGLILMNAAYTRGTVDSIDVPQLAFPRPANAAGGSISATFRQTILGFEATGPTVFGAKSSANAYADFFGGFPNADFGVTAGLVRLRTARVRLDWANTSLVAAQESPFFSPLSPTSLATLGLPALAWAGNLWTWTPQIRVEHSTRFSGASSLLLQGGILDPLDYEGPASQSFRKASPGEQSRQPGYAGRVAWTNPTKQDNPTTIGVGGFFSPQRYPFDHRVNAWAATTDFQVPVGSKFEFSGELYRGNAVGGLGGGQFNSIVVNGTLGQASTAIAGLNSIGAWGQLKYRTNSRLEFNAAIGHDNPFASDLERFPANLNPIFARNQTAFLNCIFTPESSFLVSLELRHIQSFTITGSQNTADQVNLGLGYKF